MKKIFTLLFVVGMFTMAQAQSGFRDHQQNDQRNNQWNNQRNDQRGFNNGYDKERDVVVNNDSYGKEDRYYSHNSSFGRDGDMQIARINQEYDYKIQRVRNNFFMSWYEKQRQISFLQEQRQQAISMAYAKFNNYNRGGYNERGNRGNHDDRSFRQH